MPSKQWHRPCGKIFRIRFWGGFLKGKAIPQRRDTNQKRDSFVRGQKREETWFVLQHTTVPSFDCTLSSTNDERPGVLLPKVDCVRGKRLTTKYISIIGAKQKHLYPYGGKVNRTRLELCAHFLEGGHFCLGRNRSSPTHDEYMLLFVWALVLET